MKRRSIGVRASFDTERIVAADGRVNFGLAAIQSHGLLDLPSLAEPIDAPHAILLYLEILFASPTRVTSSALSNHVSKQTPSIQPELSGGSEFYRDNRESETTNFPNSSHHPLPFLSLSLSSSSRSYLPHATPSSFNAFAFISCHGEQGRIRGHSGKAILNFLAVGSGFQGDEIEDGGDKIPRTDDSYRGLSSKRGVHEREGVQRGRPGQLPRAAYEPLHAYDHAPTADVCKLGRLLEGMIKRVRA